MNTDYSPLPQNRSTRHQPKKDNAIIFCIRIAEQCTSYLSPDISGYATSGIIWKSAWKDSGALWTEDTGNYLTKAYNDGPDPVVRVRMRAGAYDSTYGSSSSVSVAAAQVLIIIKL